MKLRLERIHLKDNYTIGKLYINDIYFCDTLEDKVRDLNKDGDLDDIGEGKIYGETAIPYGIYKIVITYSPKYKRYMPLLLNVKGFEGIRIHPGNDNGDTEGCLLVGENKVKGKVINSKVTYDKLYLLLKEIFDNKEEIHIEII